MCAFDFTNDDTWGDRHECPNYLQICDELDKSKDLFKEILESLYADQELDTTQLEHYLIELSEVLQVRFPNNKILNVRSKC